MTKKMPDPSNEAWLERFMAGTQPIGTGVPAFRPQMSPAGRKVDERTELVRQMTEAATQKRLTTTERLKAMRLGKEAEERARAAGAPLKKGKPKAQG